MDALLRAGGDVMAAANLLAEEGGDDDSEDGGGGGRGSKGKKDKGKRGKKGARKGGKQKDFASNSDGAPPVLPDSKSLRLTMTGQIALARERNVAKRMGGGVVVRLLAPAAKN